MAAPYPKPTVLKILEGNPGKRPLNKNEPRPIPIAPKCPWWLKKDKIAYNEWKRVSGELERLGLLTCIDGTALAAYCKCYARWRRAEDKLDKEGQVVRFRTGYKAQSPYVNIAEKYLKLMKDFMIQFGLTPSARGRMSLPSESEEDPLEELLGSN